MMPKSVRFYYDFVSPYSYLAYTQLASIVERTGAEFVLKPVHVLTLMEMVGNAPTSATCKPKAVYSRQDLTRWAMHYKTPINPHPRFGQFSTEPLLLGAIAAESAGYRAEFTKAAFEAIWLKQADVENDEAIVGWLEDSGIPGVSNMWANKEHFRSKLAANHEAAIADGVFGVPSFKTDAGLYFGNDRLHFLEADIAS